MIIGLTGTNSSGKGTVAKYLIKKGFDYHSLSDELRAIMKEEGVPIQRDSLIVMGTEVRKKHGDGYLSERVLKKMSGNAVVDSIRTMGELETLRKQGSFTLIAVDAPLQLRFERALARKREMAEQSVEEFKEKEEREMHGKGPAQHIQEVMDHADFTITNDSTLENLYNQVDSILEKVT